MRAKGRGVSEKFNQAFELQKAGQLAPARAIYQEIIVTEPRHFGALHLCGVIEGQTGNFQHAIRLLNRAINVEPENATVYRNRALALRGLNRFIEALADYDRIIALLPDDAAAYRQSGDMLRSLGRSEEALTRYQKALTLKPDFAEAHYGVGSIQAEKGQRESALVSFDLALSINAQLPEAHNNRGVILASLGLSEQALMSYQRAINANPGNPEAYFNRATLLQQLGKLDAALTDYNHALARNVSYGPAYFNRGLLLLDLKRPETALQDFDEALKLMPQMAEAHNNRASALIALRRGKDALRNLERAIALKPDYAEAYYNRGRVLIDIGREEEALQSYERAVSLKPDYVEALINSGFILGNRLQISAALERYDRAIELNGNAADAHFNKATLLLLSGDFSAGWVEYEWRWQYRKASESIVGGKRLDMPLWLGEESIQGKTILLHDEQGLGDTIQFCRYARLVAEAGAKVILAVRESLLGIMSGLQGVTRVVSTEITPLPDCDFHCPLMSLPLAFDTTMESIPAQIPYLKCDPEKLAQWREALGESKKLRVGLVWSGGFRANEPEMWSINERRNIPLAKFAPLRHPGIEFYSLQRGEPAESELRDLISANWEGPQIIDLRLHDMPDTAALIEIFDLVISVDTSMAHLAGALGKEVWILNRFDTDWRWLLDKSDSPWYPTARIYRQDKPGNWDGVIQRVACDLGYWCDGL
ncbi:MAG: tetratricopeptide repeat protein [Steroidobacteraceae bacterium]